ncbi:MAG: prephenate dehydratase [Firmicutes bacterium]|nr:prephenate dehydratase [Bacillota bacterium]
MSGKMAYLGPQATFCEEAARRYAAGNKWELIPYNSIAAVFAAVQNQEVERGIVPIENSCEGSVNQTLDLLAYEFDLQIVGEIILPIKHNLLTRAGVKRDEITRILSHPQALAQCRKYLAAKYQEVEYVDVTSTAEAARRVAKSSEAWAAIGTVEAARSYGLVIMSQEIQDRQNNETRFVILARESSPLVINAKTSLVLYLPDKPGALFRTLEQFSLHDINLTKIESRPAQTRMGDYLFFIDIRGHQLEPPIQKALAGLKSIADEVRILGSYPAAATP